MELGAVGILRDQVKELPLMSGYTFFHCQFLIVLDLGFRYWT